MRASSLRVFTVHFIYSTSVLVRLKRRTICKRIQSIGEHQSPLDHFFSLVFDSSESSFWDALLATALTKDRSSSLLVRILAISSRSLSLSFSASHQRLSSVSSRQRLLPFSLSRRFLRRSGTISRSSKMKPPSLPPSFLEAVSAHFFCFPSTYSSM